MYASMKRSESSGRMTANERRAWNDALQATVLALACDEPDPLCPDALIDADPSVDCAHKDRARELIIKRTGSYIFENEWQSFRTRQNRDLELTTAEHTYQRRGRYTVAVKVIDIFGNDTMTLVPVNVG